MIPGHYQPVIVTETEAFNPDEVLDIQTMLYILYQNEGELKREKGYLVPSDEIDGQWAKVELSKSFHLFPTIAAGHYGALIQFKGKEYVVYYEDPEVLIIGHDTTLYAFKNEQGVEDCLTVFDFIFTELEDWLSYAQNTAQKK